MKHYTLQSNLVQMMFSPFSNTLDWIDENNNIIKWILNNYYHSPTCMIKHQ